MNQKSIPLVALQLLKRWRNKCYDQRKALRCPPSVVLSYYVAALGGRRATLLDELRAQAANLLETFKIHDALGQKISVRNPACDEDIFTDRWPEDLTAQARFTADLQSLGAKLDELAAGPSLPEAEKILSSLFGERPTRAAVTDFAKRFQRAAEANALRHRPASAAIALGASGLAGATSGVSRPAPRNTNFGSDDR